MQEMSFSSGKNVFKNRHGQCHFLLEEKRFFWGDPAYILEYIMHCDAFVPIPPCSDAAVSFH